MENKATPSEDEEQGWRGWPRQMPDLLEKADEGSIEKVLRVEGTEKEEADRILEEDGWRGWPRLESDTIHSWSPGLEANDEDIDKDLQHRVSHQSSSDILNIHPNHPENKVSLLLQASVVDIRVRQSSTLKFTSMTASFATLPSFVQSLLYFSFHYLMLYLLILVRIYLRSHAFRQWPIYSFIWSLHYVIISLSTDLLHDWLLHSQSYLTLLIHKKCTDWARPRVQCFHWTERVNHDDISMVNSTAGSLPAHHEVIGRQRKLICNDAERTTW